jgi:large subunit ribosomal protein L4
MAVSKKKVVKKKAVTADAAVKIATKPAKKITDVKNVSVDVYNLSGKVVGSMDLPGDIFGLKPNAALIAQAVRVYRANQRAGSASTLTRGEVTGSTRKIYRQKGTGRARHGGVRAPIFVKGGIAHGPKPTDFSRSMPQKMRRKALFSALSAKVADGSIKVVDGLEKIEPKTKIMVKALAALRGDAKVKRTLVVVPTYTDNIIRAARNIPGVTYMSTQQLNTYETVKHTSIVFMKDAVAAMQKGPENK